MIDATKAPTPTWKRYAMAVILTGLLVIVGYVIWAKELHHSSPGGSSAPATSTVSGSGALAQAKRAPVPTVPGGIRLTGRNPFTN
jgi:hypothetical protein